MTKKRTSILVGLVFLSGVVLGATGASVVIIRKLLQVYDATPEVARDLVVQRLKRRLSLSAEQAKSITPVVGETTDKVMELRKRIEPDLTAAVREGVERARPFLSTEQQAGLERDFDSFIKHYRHMNGEPAQ